MQLPVHVPARHLGGDCCPLARKRVLRDTSVVQPPQLCETSALEMIPKCFPDTVDGVCTPVFAPCLASFMLHRRFVLRELATAHACRILRACLILRQGNRWIVGLPVLARRFPVPINGKRLVADCKLVRKRLDRAAVGTLFFANARLDFRKGLGATPHGGGGVKCFHLPISFVTR